MSEPQQAQAEAAPPEQTTLPANFNELVEQAAIAQMQGAAPGGDLASLASSLAQPEVPVAEAVESNEPPVTTEPTEEAPPVETPTEEVSPTIPVQEEPETYDRIRIGKYSEEDQAYINAAHILAKKTGISFADAFGRVAGLNQPKVDVEPEPEPEVEPEIVALQTEIADIEAKLTEAGKEDGVFNSEIAKLTLRLSKANTELVRREMATQNQQTPDVKREVDDAVFMMQRNQVVAAVPREFPDMADDDSLQHMMAVALGKKIADSPSHPLYNTMLNSPDAPLILAREAAKLVESKGGKVTRPGKQEVRSTPPAKPTASTPTTSQPAKPGPAPGSRTTAPQVQVTVQDVLKAAEDDLMSVLSGRGSKLPPTNPHNAVFYRR